MVSNGDAFGYEHARADVNIILNDDGRHLNRQSLTTDGLPDRIMREHLNSSGQVAFFPNFDGRPLPIQVTVGADVCFFSHFNITENADALINICVLAESILLGPFPSVKY